MSGLCFFLSFYIGFLISSVLVFALIAVRHTLKANENNRIQEQRAAEEHNFWENVKATICRTDSEVIVLSKKLYDKLFARLSVQQRHTAIDYPEPNFILFNKVIQQGEEG